MHRNSSLTHQILEQPAISGTQRLSRSPGTQDELAEAFLLVHQRQAERLRDRSSGLSGDGQAVRAPESNRYVWQLQRVSNGLHNAGQHGVRGKGYLQPLAQARQDGIRLVAMPIQQVVDRTLRSFAERLKQHRHEASGQ